MRERRILGPVKSSGVHRHDLIVILQTQTLRLQVISKGLLLRQSLKSLYSGRVKLGHIKVDNHLISWRRLLDQLDSSRFLRILIINISTQTSYDGTKHRVLILDDRRELLRTGVILCQHEHLHLVGHDCIIVDEPLVTRHLGHGEVHSPFLIDERRQKRSIHLLALEVHDSKMVCRQRPRIPLTLRPYSRNYTPLIECFKLLLILDKIEKIPILIQGKMLCSVSICLVGIILMKDFLLRKESVHLSHMVTLHGPELRKHRPDLLVIERKSLHLGALHIHILGRSDNITNCGSLLLQGICLEQVGDITPGSHLTLCSLEDSVPPVSRNHRPHLIEHRLGSSLRKVLILRIISIRR